MASSLARGVSQHRMSKADWRIQYVDRYYRSRPNWLYGTTEFHQLLSKYIHRESLVLEIGAGSSNPTSRYLALTAREVVGLDTDSSVYSNEFLSEAHMYQGEKFPFSDGHFDAVVSNYVKEHLPFPERTCQEISRVLREDGCFVFRTPNQLHYVALAGRVIPHSVTRRLAKWLRTVPGGAPDSFPTYYRLNMPGRCRSVLWNSGFEIKELVLVEKEPTYGMRWRPLFLCFMLYERLVNSSRAFAPIRANIFCAARKVRRGRRAG